MAIQSASATFTRFYVPEPNTSDFWDFVAEKFRTGGFRVTDEGQEVAAGFVSIDDPFDTDFAYASYHKGEYVAFSFRIDQRRVPAMVLKQHVREAIQKYREENEGKWPSRHERQEIQENMKSVLLARAFSQPSMAEVIWNPARNWMLVGTTSGKMLEAFLEHFEKHFQVFPVPLHHVNWALHFAPVTDREKDVLGTLVQVNSSQALEEGRFLGLEFLTWIWFYSECFGDNFKLPDGREAKILPGERMVLTLPGVDKEKVVCSTQANELHEARTALRQGKQVCDVQLLLTVAENEYLLTLDSALGAVKGLKTPKQLPDYEQEDEDGRFLEKMYFLEEVAAALDIVYGAYLTQRLGSRWDAEILPMMRKWMEASAERVKGD